MKRKPRSLDTTEIRVLGALLEKEQATPDYYPMTVNGLVNACNQKTNRAPVMQLAQDTVQEALDRLFEEDVFVWRSFAGRATKWKQNVDRRWELTPATKAAMTLLLLRGPQTAGEIRNRSDRLHPFASVSEVDQALRRLADGEEPLVALQTRQPGQKEDRWAHAVGEEVAHRGLAPERDVPTPRSLAIDTAAPPRTQEMNSDLEARVDRLEQTMADLLKKLDGLLS